ncbi:unnamed protein product [Schistosoma margrebowiei]|uniref:Uncharacterized protein n=1 Tax=Schistosoma margrebowiei TaxID=48269 RepID=A0A183N514_9TREM|nr:unnamed protein product [Schistosoma margrebowiei]
MVVGGSQKETLDPGFVLLGTRQQGVPVILRESVLPARRSEDIFDMLSIYRESSDLIWSAIAEVVEHGVPTSDLVRMHDRAPLARFLLGGIGDPLLLDTEAR